MVNDNRVIQATFATYKPVPSRGVLTLQLEVDENEAQNALEVLGYPIQGKQILVAVARLNDKFQNIQGGAMPKLEEVNTPNPTPELSKRITHAALLCKEVLFQKFVEEVSQHTDHISCSEGEELAKSYIYKRCNIDSLSELASNKEAYITFQSIKQDFEGWKIT